MLPRSFVGKQNGTILARRNYEENESQHMKESVWESVCVGMKDP